MDWDNLGRLKPVDEAKLVLAGREDYLWARDLIREKRARRALHRSWSRARPRTRSRPPALARWVLEDALPVRLQLQLHKALWPGVERGV